MAFDGDPQTRWCASGGGLNEWLMLDLGSELPVEAIEVDWEFPDLDYEFAVEWSNEGQAWNRLASGSSRDASKRLKLTRSARFLRVRPLELPEGKWASIREIRLYGPDGKPITNRRLPAGQTPAEPDFDDSAWRTLDVPHDWGIEGPFRDDLPGDTGKLPWKGIGWYRKHFNVPAGDQGKRIFIDFDGAMANAKVWLNGQDVGGWPYGYQPFRLELTPHVKFGAENVLAVRLDTAHWGSRWYPGAGLYRNVWLVKTNPVHVGHWGVFVTTPSITDEKGIARAGRRRWTTRATGPMQRHGPGRTSSSSGPRDRPAARSPHRHRSSGRSAGRRLGQGRACRRDRAQSQAVGPGGDPTSTSRERDRSDRATSSSTSTTSPSASARSSSRPATASSSTAAACRSTAPATITTSARWAPRSTSGPSSGSSRSSRRWAATRCGPRTIRPRRSCWTWPTGWASS